MSPVVLDPSRVTELFNACLLIGNEDTDDRVVVEALATTSFSRTLLEQHREEIAALLDELPDSFKATGGGGMSFLAACNDRHGRQWTGLHMVMEQLFQLGMAINKAEYLAPREVWPALPGGMPYILVK